MDETGPEISRLERPPMPGDETQRLPTPVRVSLFAAAVAVFLFVVAAVTVAFLRVAKFRRLAG
jgi:hypothetical protein